MEDGRHFAMKMPEWVAELKDETVARAIFVLLFSHNVDGEPFTEDGLKKELSEYGGLSEKQQKEAFDLIVSHKD